MNSIEWLLSKLNKPTTVSTPPPIENVSPVPLKPIIPSKPNMRVLCVDVSHYEPAVDWSKAGATVKLMHTKATEGLGHVDVMLHKHCDAAKAAGLYIGAYHFFHASMDGARQAKFFLETVAGMKFDAPHVLDWEGSSADGKPAAEQIKQAKAWLDVVEAAIGRPPMIYGGESFLRGLKLPLEFVKYPLWLAHYGTTEGKLIIPKPWANFTMWQYADNETVPGLASGHHVDASLFRGSKEDLAAFIKG